MLAGRLRDQFVVDVYQAGAGTSHNMNANEVLANRAAEILGEPRGTLHARPPERSRQHGAVDQRRVPDRDAAGAADGRRAAGAAPRRSSPRAWRGKADEFADVLKTGRTHLQDAVPITLGQEFSGYAACIAPRRGRCGGGVRTAAGAEHRRHGGRHRAQRRRRLSAAGRRTPRARDRPAAETGGRTCSG